MMNGTVDCLYRIGFRSLYTAALAWWAIRRPTTRGSLVAIWRNDRVLMVRTSYRSGMQLPGGFRHGTESAQETAIRETREEVDLDLPPDALGAPQTFFQTFEYRRDAIDIFDVHLDTDVLCTIDHREIVEMAYLTPRDALASTSVPALREYFTRNLHGHARRGIEDLQLEPEFRSAE